MPAEEEDEPHDEVEEPVPVPVPVTAHSFLGSFKGSLSASFRGMFRKKLPDWDDYGYTEPAWAHHELAGPPAPWYLEVYLEVHEDKKQVGTVNLSTQARFLCGRSGGVEFGLSLDIGSHESISR